MELMNYKRGYHPGHWEGQRLRWYEEEDTTATASVSVSLSTR